uniref:Uncharacterized protein n=1 Tax=Anguilla anguilla TaxID=7936 RepID=A0A0E9TQ90_ANGAN
MRAHTRPVFSSIRSISQQKIIISSTSLQTVHEFSTVAA